MTLTKNRQYLDFTLQDLAEQYFELNGNIPINFYPIDKQVVDGTQPRVLTNANGTIVVPYLWFWGLVSRSGLDGYGDDVGCNDWARGVLASAEGNTENFHKKKGSALYQ